MGEFRRVLVVANETVAGRELHDKIKSLTADGAKVKVVAPALAPRLRFMMSDVDGARAKAQERLDSSLAALEASQIAATGEIGDADPVRAFKDQVAIFDPDAVVVSTHPKGRSNWLEEKVVDHISACTEVSVTHVVVDLEAQQAEADPRAA
ncbi:MAG: hypothetical protein WAP35_08785 [Solirubrobacterales bacterium]